MFVPSEKISTNSHALLTEFDIGFDSIVITESRKVNDISKPIFPPTNIVLADYATEQTPNNLMQRELSSTLTENIHTKFEKT